MSLEVALGDRWQLYQPLIARCTEAEFTSAVLLGPGGGIHNVFAVLALTRQGEGPPGADEFKYLLERPETVPGTRYRLAIGRSRMPVAKGLAAVTSGAGYTEPVKGTGVSSPGTWAAPVFVGHEYHRLLRLLPSLDAQFWVFQHVQSVAHLQGVCASSALDWVRTRVSTTLRSAFSERVEYLGSLFVLVPEYRARLRVERGADGRIGIEVSKDDPDIRPVVSVRASRGGEFCDAKVQSVEGRYTVLNPGATEYQDVNLHDLNTGLLIDRDAGLPFRGFTQVIHAGEPIKFQAVLHETDGSPSGAPVEIETNWGRFQQSATDDAAEWERTQRAAALLAERERLVQQGRLFFYSGEPGERERAVHDVRGLIRSHTRRLLRVWDQYFSGWDALQFLPHVGDPSVQVQVLTSLSPLPGQKDRPRVRAQLSEAVAELAKPRGRGPGMTNIEVKVGYRFHDRFLITDIGCWQLGASYNQIGKVYSTIVEFPFPQKVVQAFNDAWGRAKSL